MKKIFSIIAISVLGFSQAQVIIGDQTGTASNKTSVLLEFAAGQNKGIILPYVRTLPAAADVTEGTILVDATNQTGAAVRYYNGSWKDLSNGNKGNITTALSNQPSTTTEDANAKAIIGANTSAAKGVLVLESTTKAMVLPQVASTDEIINPAPGMMVYINGTNKRLAVFNGAKWTFWAP